MSWLWWPLRWLRPAPEPVHRLSPAGDGLSCVCGHEAPSVFALYLHVGSAR